MSVTQILEQPQCVPMSGTVVLRQCQIERFGKFALLRLYMCLIEELPGEIDGDSKVEALRVLLLKCGQPDHLAALVEDGSSTVTGIDGCIRLDPLPAVRHVLDAAHASGSE